MKYPYTVKHNGKYYAAGEDVPNGASSKPEENKADTAKVEKPEKDGKGAEITQADINQLSGAKLRSFAAENGIADAETYTNGELKKMLIERLGL